MVPNGHPSSCMILHHPPSSCIILLEFNLNWLLMLLHGQHAMDVVTRVVHVTRVTSRLSAAPTDPS